MIKPKCHPYWIINGEKVVNEKRQELGHSFLGYVLPCCWMDSAYDETNPHSLFDEDLKLSKHESIKSILLSKQWVKFHHDLLNNPDNVLEKCKGKCSE
jgi:hypothetical protein